jgi:hypothetical protein
VVDVPQTERFELQKPQNATEYWQVLARIPPSAGAGVETIKLLISINHALLK